MATLRAFVFLLGALTLICNARVFDDHVHARVFDDHVSDFFPGAPLDWNATIIKRQSGGDVTNPSDCFVPCAPGTCGGLSCNVKRSFKGNFDNFNESILDGRDLEKRYLSLPTSAAGIVNYLNQQSANPSINLICPAQNTPQYGFSFCVQQEFSTAPLNGNNQWLAGTANTLLVGCTVLTVVSSRSVYMCHFWEDINYIPQPYRRPLQGFQPILDLVQNGRQSTYAAGPALNTNLYTGEYDNTWAFIMTPRNRQTSNDATSQQYPNQYGQLVGLLRGLVPGIGILEYNYDTIRTVPSATEPDNPAENDYQYMYQGVALFVYDSNADNKGNADWRLWLEASSENGRKLGQNPPNGNPN